MAGLPPRDRSRSLSSSVKSRSPLETLEHMGFPRDRAEKAIAATGNHGVQPAAEWLLSHVNDPHLDNHEPREYIVYLCPTGELRKTLIEFWDKSVQLCGWNAAHMYYPHITLCTFFKIPDNKVNLIDTIMNVVIQEIGQWPCNKNFIGYFVKTPHHQYAEQLMIKVMDVFLKHGIEMRPQMKQIHMTLAFQYDADHHDLLMKLAQEINLHCDASWEIQIYSRLQDLKTSEVRRVIQNYQPAQSDELHLLENDFVYMAPEEHEHSPDGWYKGTSHQTWDFRAFPWQFYCQMLADGDVDLAQIYASSQPGIAHTPQRWLFT
ncbi:unnamed protein product [Candidula unifasciata]|uniref:UBA domain-containing protein n=1 Tax=Candidula unifasciata TaxID=100452 RepID=A0A8S3ZP91_9EUPU|nr:unnamed protein product [Candidula unifasciata]